MKKNIILIIPILLFSLLNTNMYSQEYKSALDSLFQGFKTKNYEFIKPLLDSNVKIGTLPQGMNDAIVPQILQQMPTALSYSITGEADDPDGRRIKTTYHLEDGKDREQNYLFNSDKKVIDFDVLGDAKAMAVTNAAPSELPERMEIPFKVHENVIFVKANLNGKEEFFILDSGAPTFIINSDYVVSNIQSTAAKATGVGGKAEISVVHIDSFDWNGLKMENFDGMAMSLGHLEKRVEKSLRGL